MKLFIHLLFLLLTISATTSAFASRFANQFVEFELPPGWQCNLEGAEWVCQNNDEIKRRDAIVILAAKLKSDQDSLDQYQDYLKNPKLYVSVMGKQVKSEVKYAKSVSINQQAWIDSLHLESEIPGFYTRYLATVKEDIGVLVTYSINKAKYQDYIQDFDALIKTLRVFRKAGGINTQAQGNLFQNITIPTAMNDSTVFPGGAPIGGGADTVASDVPVKKQKKELPIVPIVIGIMIVGFLALNNKKK